MPWLLNKCSSPVPQMCCQSKREYSFPSPTSCCPLYMSMPKTFHPVITGRFCGTKVLEGLGRWIKTEQIKDYIWVRWNGHHSHEPWPFRKKEQVLSGPSSVRRHRNRLLPWSLLCWNCTLHFLTNITWIQIITSSFTVLSSFTSVIIVVLTRPLQLLLCNKFQIT